VPCELWFLNRNKPQAHRDKVLMIDARNIYRKLTRKIYEFSPEQLQNLLAIVWLYRGQEGRFLELLSGYLRSMLDELSFCYQPRSYEQVPLWGYVTALNDLIAFIDPFAIHSLITQRMPKPGSSLLRTWSFEWEHRSLPGGSRNCGRFLAETEKNRYRRFKQAVQRLLPWWMQAATWPAGRCRLQAGQPPGRSL